MFTVSYHILGTRISWSDTFYFESKKEAEEYLEKKKFRKTNSIFYEKESNGWFPKTSAMITMLKKYKGEHKQIKRVEM